MRRVIGFKTVEVGLLTGGWVLDGGCLGLGFAHEMIERGQKVLAVDPAPEIVAPPYFEFERVALVPVGYRGTIKYAINEKPECRRTGCGRMDVTAKTIPQLMSEYQIDQFDCVKLNIEGAEEPVLMTWPGPIAKQITVSFHASKQPSCELVRQHIDLFIVGHLNEWYEAVQHEWTAKPPGIWDYWDSLFILKELL